MRQAHDRKRKGKRCCLRRAAVFASRHRARENGVLLFLYDLGKIETILQASRIVFAVLPAKGQTRQQGGGTREPSEGRKTNTPHEFIVNDSFNALARCDVLEDIRSVALCLFPGQLPTRSKRPRASHTRGIIDH